MFSTGSGKSVRVSKTSLERGRQLTEAADDDEGGGGGGGGKDRQCFLEKKGSVLEGRQAVF